MSSNIQDPAVTELASPAVIPAVVPVAPADAPGVTEQKSGLGLGLWMRDLLISAFVSVLIILFLYQPVRVEGTSMLPVLEDEDRLFINKFAYSRLGSILGDDIHRGDVVVFQFPRDRSKSYIKRVIAVPGDS